MAKYSRLSDQEINILVAKIQHPDKTFIESKTRPPSVVMLNHVNRWVDYCNNWSDGGPIIVDNGISLECIMVNKTERTWRALFKPTCVVHKINDKNPLRAAMIVFLMMKNSE